MKLQSEVWDYEYSNHKNKWKKERIVLPKLLKNKRVLELGVGNGKNINAMIRQNPLSITAIDYSYKAIELCKKKFGEDNLNFICMDMTKTDFKDESFDVILCYYVLNNLLYDERKKAVQEMHRILSKKGILIFEDFDNKDIRDKKGMKEIEKNTLVKKNGINCHFFSEDEIKKTFKNFKIMKLNKKEFRVVLKDPKSIRRLISIVAVKK